jgi:hypothetical protein
VASLVTVFTATDQAEALAVRAVLEASKIRCEVHATVAAEGGAGPASRAKTGWGEVQVDAENADWAVALVRGWLSTRQDRLGSDDILGIPMPDPDAVGRVNFLGFVVPVLLLFSVVLNVGLLSAIVIPKFQQKPAPSLHHEIRDAQNRKVAAYDYVPGQPFPIHSWSYRKDGTVRAEFFDAHGDGWTDHSVGQSRDGRFKDYAEDLDKDGVVEKWVTTRDGKPIARIEDTDQNGIHERTVLLDGTREIGEWDDADQDGITERGVLFDANGAPRAELHDEDKDGFPEIASCGNGKARLVLDLGSCRLLK